MPQNNWWNRDWEQMRCDMKEICEVVSASVSHVKRWWFRSDQKCPSYPSAEMGSWLPLELEEILREQVRCWPQLALLCWQVKKNMETNTSHHQNTSVTLVLTWRRADVTADDCAFVCLSLCFVYASFVVLWVWSPVLCLSYWVKCSGRHCDLWFSVGHGFPS